MVAIQTHRIKTANSTWEKMKRSVKRSSLLPSALYLDALNLQLSYTTHHRGESVSGGVMSFIAHGERTAQREM